MKSTRKGFTLLELLAAVALLVVLGAMLFQVFKQASDVVEISSARQEIFQYARAGLEFLERELNGAFVSPEADVSSGIKGMQIYNVDFGSFTMGNYCPRRQDSQGIFFTTALLGRDVREKVNGSNNPYRGFDANCARVAYYLNDETTQLRKAAVYRSEDYNLTLAQPVLESSYMQNPPSPAQTRAGFPFMRNCLRFDITLISRFSNEWTLQNGVPKFVKSNWDSEADVTTGGFTRRRGLPMALKIALRITDDRHTRLYKWGDPDGDSTKQWYVEGPDPTKDYWGQEDPVVQTFQQVFYYGRRSD